MATPRRRERRKGAAAALQIAATDPGIDTESVSPGAAGAGPDPAVHSDPDPAAPTEADEYLYLIGRPTLAGFLRYVRGHAISPPGKGDLTDEWKAAEARIRDLQEAEAGLAEQAEMRPLGPEYEPLLLEFFKDPLVRYGFNTVPTDVALVELDRMVVYQKHIDLTFVRQLRQRVGPAPTPAEIFRICLPSDHRQPPVRWSRVHRDTFVFLSPSNDLRFLGSIPLRSQQLTGFPPPGSLVGVVGLAVGFGSNFLNAVHAENRLILNNGSHRAYALREMGITHVPCIIQHVSSRAELEVVGSSAVRKHPERYLDTPRPALLRDYFDPALRKILPVHRRVRQITVKFQVDESFVPAL